MHRPIAWILFLFVLLHFTNGQASPWVSRTGALVAFQASQSSSAVSVWDVRGMREFCRVDAGRDPRFCELSEAVQALTVVTEQDLTVWDIRTGEQLWKEEYGEQIDNGLGVIRNFCGAAYVLDQKCLATMLKITTTTDGIERQQTLIRIQDAETGSLIKQELREIADSSYWTNVLASSPQGDRLYAAFAAEGRVAIKCWAANGLQFIGELKLDQDQSGTDSFAAGTNYLAQLLNNAKDECIIWDTRNFSELRRIKIPTDAKHGQAQPYVQVIDNAETILVATEGNATSAIHEVDLQTVKTISQHTTSYMLASRSGRDSVKWLPGTDTICFMDSGYGRSDKMRSLFLAQLQRPHSRDFDLAFQVLKGRRETAVLLPHSVQAIVTEQPKEISVYEAVKSDSKELRYHVKVVPLASIKQDRTAIQRVLTRLLKSSPTTLKSSSNPALPRLFVLTIGISDFVRNEYDLKSPRKTRLVWPLRYKNFNARPSVTYKSKVSRTKTPPRSRFAPNSHGSPALVRGMTSRSFM